MVSQMVRIGEETGELEKMLGKVADFYEDEVEAAIDGLSAMIEPLMMIMVGAMVGVIVISMYLPMFKMLKLVSQSGWPAPGMRKRAFRLRRTCGAGLTAGDDHPPCAHARSHQGDFSPWWSPPRRRQGRWGRSEACLSRVVARPDQRRDQASAAHRRL